MKEKSISLKKEGSSMLEQQEQKRNCILLLQISMGMQKERKKSSIFLEEILDRDITQEFENPMVVKSDDDLNMYTQNKEDLIPKDIKIEVGKKVSYSQINTYQDCPKKYEYSYVLQIPSPLTHLFLLWFIYT